MFNVAVYHFTYSFSLLSTKIGKTKRRFNSLNYLFCSLIRLAPCVIAPALPELLWLPTAWRCPL